MAFCIYIVLASVFTYVYFYFSVTTGSRAKLPSHVGVESQKRKERSSRLQEGAYKPIRELKNED